MQEKTLESPLDNKEISPVNPKGNQPWIFTGRTNVRGEAPMLWPPALKSLVQLGSIQSLSRVWLFATPWIAACQASLSITNSWSSLRLTSIELVMPSSHLILCCPLLLLPPIPPSIRVFTLLCGEGKGYPLQYSGLEKSMDYIVHGVAKSQTWLSNFHFHF